MWIWEDVSRLEIHVTGCNSLDTPGMTVHPSGSQGPTFEFVFVQMGVKIIKRKNESEKFHDGKKVPQVNLPKKPVHIYCQGK